MHASCQPGVKSAAGVDASGTSPGTNPAGEVAPCKLKNGSEITIRPICPADEPLMIKFHRTLSERSVYFRYLGPLKLSQRISHQRLMRVCLNYKPLELALVAERKLPHSRKTEILGVGRLIKADATHEAEFALVVGDRHQCSGLGTQLLHRLVKIAADERQSPLVGYILPENRLMLHICEKLGFQRVHPLGDPVVRMELDLSKSTRPDHLENAVRHH